MKSFYTQDDSPTASQKEMMWSQVESEFNQKQQPARVINVDWRSFWYGQIAAVVVLMAGIGLFSVVQFINQPNTTSEQYQQALNHANQELSTLPNVFLNEASEREKPILESTVQGIEEIDLLIEELKDDIIMHGTTPAKELQMKRLYATKLDFYKDLLLISDDQL